MITVICLICIIMFIIIVVVVQKSKKEDEREMERLAREKRCRMAKEELVNSTCDNPDKVEAGGKSFVTQNERMLGFDVTRKLEEKSDSQFNPPVLRQGKEELNTESRKIVLEVQFKDNWYDGQDDFSELSPSEARERLEEAKEDGDWLEQEEYYGLINAIAAGKDDKYLEKIEGMTPKQTEEWFERNNRCEIRMSTVVWIAVGQKVAPIHESFLIDGMRTKSSKSIDGFVHARKKEGYFFTDRAYRLANRIYSGEFDGKEQNVFLRQQLNIADI